MFKSTHNLEFQVAEYELNTDPNEMWIRFKIGSCTGLWRSDDDSYIILAVSNMRLNNGHLEDVFDWFKQSCLRDDKSLLIKEVWNQKFKKHLIEKRGFVKSGKNDVIINYVE